MVGGVVFFAKLDRRTPADVAFRDGGIRGQADLPYWLAPASMFEEFNIGRELVNGRKLSDFLVREELRGLSKRDAPLEKTMGSQRRKPAR